MPFVNPLPFPGRNKLNIVLTRPRFPLVNLARRAARWRWLLVEQRLAGELHPEARRIENRPCGP